MKCKTGIGLLLAALVAATAFAQTPAGPNKAVLTWTAPTTNVDNSAITGALTYNVYSVAQGQDANGTQVTAAVAANTFTVTGLAAGSTECYYITAVEAGVESSPSNAACTTFPNPAPNAPTGLTIQQAQ